MIAPITHHVDTANGYLVSNTVMGSLLGQQRFCNFVERGRYFTHHRRCPNSPSINDCPATNLTPCSGMVACGSSETNAD